MSCKTSYELYHQFPKLAKESGFTFSTHHPRIHIDWNKIRIIDIENLIRERQFNLLEQHINDILDCVLESEFDVRILDEGVLKMFRLAQLTVEYQQFCRHYLDRSVLVLRGEITTLAQELDATKKELREKEEELRKFKRKTKHTFRTPLPYGNENIATMILKTLSNKGDMFPTISNVDTLQYNKCGYCDKVFMNQLYLKSHISRRHTDVVEIPQRDVETGPSSSANNDATTKLNDEILELKSKLKAMESMITRAQETSAQKQENTENKSNPNNNNNISKEVKDAAVSVSNDNYVIEKIEEWKKEEHEKYNKEINLLRAQILESINDIKEKETQKPTNNISDSHEIEQLRATIIQQGSQIITLKEELEKNRMKSDNEVYQRRKEVDSQIAVWANRAEMQSKQYEALLQKLNDVAKEAQASRILAETEKERAKQLQDLLEKSINEKRTENNNITNSSNARVMGNQETKEKETRPVKQKVYHKPSPVADRLALENLHRKAQELLNIASISSSSDVTTEEKIISPAKPKIKQRLQNYSPDNITDKSQKTSEKANHNVQIHDVPRSKEKKLRKEKSQGSSNHKMFKENGPILVPGSPIKVVRAKITEEVNSRLISVGVDPLKSRLSQNVFQKQYTHLHQQRDLKSKKNSAYAKMRRSILTRLDSDSSHMNKSVVDVQDYASPTNILKASKLTSMISNVKTKALSFVKSIDGKENGKALNAAVIKRATSLLKTPPESEPTTPSKQLNYNVETKLTPTRENSDGDLKSKQNMIKLENKQKTTRGKRLGSNSDIGRTLDDSDDDTDDSDNDKKYYNHTVQQASKTIENLIKSPARRPSSANDDNNRSTLKYTIDNNSNNLQRTQSEINIFEVKTNNENIKSSLVTDENSSDDVESIENISIKKGLPEEILQINSKQTKGVLKNASSTSSLNKKKVLFDMDAIQMKSVSASPSQSTTEKSDVNEKFELGLVNLDGDEWDISSIENEPLKNDTKIQVSSRTSPKIEELKQTIESQLARRTVTPSTALVGGVDVLAGGLRRASSIGGSNTSLGSSILDDSESIPPLKHKAFVKPKKVTEKDDSELDISEFSIDGIGTKNTNESF